MSKYNFVKQEDLKDCGVASLLMIIKTYGGDSNLEYLRELTMTDKDGTSFYNLIVAANEFNFEAFGLSGDIESLDCKYLPVIAHVIIDKSYQHYIVIYEINLNKKYLLIADPASGLKKISFDEFRSISTNNFLIFEPNGEILKLDMINPIYLIIKDFIKKNKIRIAKIVFLSLIYTLLSILFTFYFQISIATYLNTNLFVVIFTIYLFTIIFKGLFNYIRYRNLIKINNDLDKCLFTKTYEHIFSLPYYFYKTRTTGEILSRITDLSNIKDTISNFILSILVDLFLSIIAFIFLFNINAFLTLITIIFVVIYFIIFIIYKKTIIKWINKIKDSTILFNSFLTDTIKGIESIKGINSESYVIDLFKTKYKSVYDSNSYFNNICNKQNFFRGIIDSLLEILIIAIGIFIIKNNNLEVSNLVTYLFMMSLFIEPIKNTFNVFYSYENSKESLRRVKDLFQIEEVTNKGNFDIIFNNIKIINVSYSYKKNNSILKNINIFIDNGNKVLIYGKSGCGKSTLMKILNGYIHNYNGSVFIGDYNIKDMDNSLLNNNISYTSQNEILLNMSLKDNIIMGRDIDDNLFDKVCKLLFIDEIANKSFLAYDLILEENAANLSGGERQRVILARSILKNSDIYIFDESLCNMNIELERKVLINLFSYLEDKIVIVVSHRFYNSDLFDKKIRIGDEENESNE